MEMGHPAAALQESVSVGYVFSKQLILHADRIQNVQHRASMVHALIEAYGLLDHLTVLECIRADVDDLRSFHSGDYIDYLETITTSNDLELHEHDMDEYGLGFDCPLVQGILDLVLWLAGGSLAAARALCQGCVDVAVNWCGGWHHAQRSAASGFCYVNDIVLAINQLRQTFDRVLYVDLDIHHGDGVENAFLYSSKVFTLSIHHFADGFFPGTGALMDVGLGRGRHYCLNIPLREGATDDTFVTTFEKCLGSVLSVFRPDAVVCQCGADGLIGDPLGTFSLTPAGLGRCVTRLLGQRRPTLLLGGGGYRPADTARCWTLLTALALNRTLDTDIPDHTYFPRYGPTFDLEVSAGLRRDHNSPAYLDTLLRHVTGVTRQLGGPCDGAQDSGPAGPQTDVPLELRPQDSGSAGLQTNVPLELRPQDSGPAGPQTDVPLELRPQESGPADPQTDVPLELRPQDSVPPDSQTDALRYTS